jgi:general secretion pathway protein L
MGLRAGLYLRDERLMVVVRSSRRGQVHCFALEPGDLPGARLKTELETRRLKVRRMRIGLARPLLTVKILEVPPARGAQLNEMVAFELERHVPFPPEDIRFDFIRLPGSSKGPLRVMVAACERRTVEGALRLLEEPRLKPRAVTIACHDLASLLSRRSKVRRALWAHRAGGTTDLVCLAQGRVELSRTVPVKDGEELADEVAATLRLLGWPEIGALWISGDDASEFLASSALADFGTAVTEPPLKPRARALIAQLPEEDKGSAMLAVAAATGPARPPLNLLPAELRPRTVSMEQVATVGMVVVTASLGLALLVGQGYKQHRHAERLSQAIRALDPEVKSVEGLQAELAQKRRIAETIRTIEHADVRALPVMKELTERLPQEAWLRTLTMDKQGLEITGQASAANQLIPLLENSPSLMSVEFTAPVTKAGDKEQFRIKAAWRTAKASPEGAAKAPDQAPKRPEPAAKAPGPTKPPGPAAKQPDQPAKPSDPDGPPTIPVPPRANPPRPNQPAGPGR